MVLVSNKPRNDIGILQTKLSDRERHETQRVGLEAMPLDQHVEGRHGEGQTRLKIPVTPENPKQLPFLTFLSYDCTLDQYMSNPADALWEVSPCDLSLLLYAPLSPRSSN